MELETNNYKTFLMYDLLYEAGYRYIAKDDKGSAILGCWFAYKEKPIKNLEKGIWKGKAYPLTWFKDWLDEWDWDSELIDIKEQIEIGEEFC